MAAEKIDIQQQIDEMVAKVADLLINENDALQQTIDAMSAERDGHLATITTLEAKVDADAEVIKEINSALETCNGQLEEQVTHNKELASDLAMVEDLLKDTKYELSEVSDVCDSLESKLKVAHVQLHTANDDVKRLDKLNTDCLEALSTANARISAMQLTQERILALLNNPAE